MLIFSYYVKIETFSKDTMQNGLLGGEMEEKRDLMLGYTTGIWTCLNRSSFEIGNRE